MGSEPSGLMMILQLVFILLYALLCAAEAAAQQLSYSHRHALDSGDEEADSPEARAASLLKTPSGIRVCMLLLAMLISGITIWSYALPLSAHARSVWGWDGINPSLLTVLISLLLVVVLTLVFQLFAIMLPRRFAVNKPRTTARFLFGWALRINRVFKPLALGLDGISLAILKLFKVDVMLPTIDITEDEIRMLVDVGEEKGAIEQAEREMIKNVFEFNNMTAAECMTHRTDVYAVWVDDTVEEITSMIVESGLSRFPVYEEDLDHVIGTLTTRDFLLNQQAENPKPLRELLREARFVPESVRTDILFRDMQRNNYHLAIVVDEYGGTSGLITMEDLLEEIVGNIYDEYDPAAEAEYTELAEGRWRVAGALEVEAFNHLAGFSLPLDEEYDTIGGLILSHLSSIPEEGSQPEITMDGLRFKVESMQDRRIAWVEVNKSKDEV